MRLAATGLDFLSNKIVLDTGILIRILRGDKQIGDLVDHLAMEFRIFVSTITVLEIYVGATDQRHLSEGQKLLADFEQILVDEAVAVAAAGLVRKYSGIFGRGVNRGLADVLIAACAKVAGAKLLTLNNRQFGKLEESDLEVEVV